MKIKVSLMKYAFVMALALTALAKGVVAQEAPIVIKAARVLDGTGKVSTNVGIVIQGTKILRIEAAPKTPTYDLAAVTVMPGWIETHAHISAHFDRKTGRAQPGKDETSAQTALYTVENLQKLLMNGFTTVQSPGESADKDFREWIAEGRIAGPRLRTSVGVIRNLEGEPPLTPDQIRQMART